MGRRGLGRDIGLSVRMVVALVPIVLLYLIWLLFVLTALVARPRRQP